MYVIVVNLKRQIGVDILYTSQINEAKKLITFGNENSPLRPTK